MAIDAKVIPEWVGRRVGAYRIEAIETIVGAKGLLSFRGVEVSSGRAVTVEVYLEPGSTALRAALRARLEAEARAGQAPAILAITEVGGALVVVRERAAARGRGAPAREERDREAGADEAEQDEVGEDEPTLRPRMLAAEEHFEAEDVDDVVFDEDLSVAEEEARPAAREAAEHPAPPPPPPSAPPADRGDARRKVKDAGPPLPDPFAVGGAPTGAARATPSGAPAAPPPPSRAGAPAAPPSPAPPRPAESRGLERTSARGAREGAGPAMADLDLGAAFGSRAGGGGAAAPAGPGAAPTQGEDAEKGGARGRLAPKERAPAPPPPPPPPSAPSVAPPQQAAAAFFAPKSAKAEAATPLAAPAPASAPGSASEARPQRTVVLADEAPLARSAPLAEAAARLEPPSESDLAPAKARAGLFRRSAPRAAKPAAPPEPKPAARPKKKDGFALTDEQERQKQELATTLDRRATVRHYKQLNPGKTYPLLVVISEGRIEQVRIAGVAQVESKQTFSIKKENPFVRIEPVLAGCAIAPTSIDLDVSRKVAEARFLVTPIVEGDIPDARVEIRYEGRTVDSVPIPSKIAKQTIAKISAALSFVSPVLTKLVPLLTGGRSAEELAKTGALGAYGRVVAWAGGTTNLGLGFTGLLGLVALVFYLRNRAKEADPVERFFDYATAGREPEDLEVTRRKQRVVVLAPGERREHRLDVREALVGGDPGATIFLRDGSVGFQHAMLAFDGAAFRVVALGGGPIEVEGRRVEEALLPDKEATVKVGAVELWLYRATEDDEVDAPAFKERLAAALCSILPQRAEAIRSALAAAGRPAREAIAELLVDGALDLASWRDALALARGRRAG